MTVCAVDGCDAEATDSLHVAASLGGGRNIYLGPPVVLDEVEMDVPLCASHRDYLMRDSLRGISLGGPPES